MVDWKGGISDMVICAYSQRSFLQKKTIMKKVIFPVTGKCICMNVGGRGVKLNVIMTLSHYGG